MALTAEMESLLVELEKVDPAGAKEQRAILEKYPKMQEGMKGHVLRQSDYDRFLNENKGKLAKVDEWSEWARVNQPLHRQLMTDYATAQEEIERLKAEVEAKSIAAAAAAGGSGADADKITAAVKAAIKEAGGMPTKTELAVLIKGATDEQMKDARKDFYEKEIPRNLAFVTAMTTAQNRYFRETGKDMDTAEFSKFMVDNNLSDPARAYEKFMDPINRQKSIDEEVKKQVTAKEEELKKQYGASGIPGSTGAQSPGHLQIRLTEKKAGDPLFSQDIELGDNAAAMAAAAELRSEGKVA